MRLALIHQKIREGGISLLLSADAENPIHAGGACKVQEGRSSSARGTELITEYCGTTANYCEAYFVSAAVAVDSSHMIASVRHHPLRGVDSVHRQILLIGTCRQCRS